MLLEFDPFTLAAEVIVELLQRTRWRFGIGPVGFELGLIGPQAKESADERLAKIDLARHSLSEALEAVDALKADAEENRRDLDRLAQSLAEAEAKKRDVSAEIAAMREIATMDSGAVRRGLGLPTPVDLWRERLIGGFFGVLAGIIATALWQFLIQPHLH